MNKLFDIFITDEALANAKNEADEAVARYNGLRQKHRQQWLERQRNPEATPQWVDTRTIPMDRKGQADVRLIYIGFNDLDRKNRVIDFYPIDGDVVWQLGWTISDVSVSDERRNAVFEKAKPFANLSFDEKHETFVSVPCVKDGCSHTTEHSIYDVETLADKTERLLDAGASNREGKAVYKTVMHEFVSNYVCPTCKGENRLLNKWEQACPAVFREGKDKSDRRFFPPSAWKEMQKWGQNIMDCTRSLYVYGDTGICKSRMMFEILRDYVVENGLSFKVYAGGEFRREQELIMQTRFDRKPQRIVSDAETVDVLVFDDLGQDDLNGSMRSNLRWLIDYRLTNGLRTIFLANVSPEELKLSYGDGISINTLTRRIMDYCDIVRVGATKTMLDASIERGREKLALKNGVEDIPPDESPF